MRDIIVNVGERETRIALLEEGKLVELQIERAERVVGSLYKCRVMNVLQGMDAAFVDIGLERNAFLYVGDVLPGSEDGAVKRAGKDIRIPQVEPLPISSLPSADTLSLLNVSELEEEFDPEVEIEDSDEILADENLPVENLQVEEPGETASASPRPRHLYRRSTLRQQRIKDVLKVGQELVVQVIKGPRSTKGARVSTRISLPGRYLVLMPEADHLGVSRKIEESSERERLRLIGEKLRPAGYGLIIRTEAEEKAESELRSDMEFLLQSWLEVKAISKDARAPSLILQDLTLLYKTIRDVFGSDVQRLIVDDPVEYEKANLLLERISPKLAGRVQLYDGSQPLFDVYKIEDQIDKLLRRKVYLKSGASLVIDETEALTVIDVNTSKNVGGSSLAETILRTNIEAAEEIARQLRLRDIGGIIVIDFIDMTNPKDRQTVIKALENVLKRDRSRTKVSSISRLGLVEMTRKRTGETLTGLLTEECPYCKGQGQLPTSESSSLLIERDLRRMAAEPKMAIHEAFRITCHPEVAELLIGPDGATVEEMERQMQHALYIRAEVDYHIEKYTIEPGNINDFEKSAGSLKKAQVVECLVMRSALKEGDKCVGLVDGNLLDLDDGNRLVGHKTQARITMARRSYLSAQVVTANSRLESH